MGIKFTNDNHASDFSAGGGLNANWTKSFTDYHQTHLDGAHYIAGGQTGYSPTMQMPYYYTLTVQPRNDPSTGSYDSDGGNRFYPVSFASGSVRRASSTPNMVIYRGYNLSGAHQFETANSVDIGWTGSSTHQGGLYSAWYTGDSAWSDMYEAHVTRHRRTYHTTVGGYGMQLSYDTDRGSGPFWVMLRGGFTYYIGSTHPSLPAQVTAGGSCFSYGGNNQFRTWPASTTTADSQFNDNIMEKA